MNNTVLVAAIDFGTTFSGYAFSFRHEYERDPLTIHANNWIAGNQALVSLKTPSVVLLTPDRKFHSFGYEAENKYSQLAEDESHKGWLYFRRFKMLLHKNKCLRRTTTIKDVNGEEMPAKTIFTMAIKYLHDHLMNNVKQRVDTFADDLVTWVLTVPAIWDEGAKQFMIECADDAGIKRKQLLLALEPEAASIYCNKVPVTSGKGRMNTSSFGTGSKYMVLDLGGGTADITVHEVLKNGTLREIHSATGGAWGGTKVDDAFYQFLAKLFGNDVLVELKEECMEDYICLFRDFETKKRTIKPDADDKVTIRLPYKLLEIFREHTDEELSEAIPQTTFAKKVAQKGDKLQVAAEIFKGFFEDTVQGIVAHTLEVLNSRPDDDITKVLLVGGFSESPMVVKSIKDVFPGKKIIAPSDPGLAVLKGAVLFGHNPDVISSRISKFTIGFEVNTPFIDGLHPKRYRIVRPTGEVMCQHIFEVFVKKGEEIPIGHKIENSYTPSDEDASSGIAMYQSTCENPTFTSEKSCSKLGAIVIRKPNGGWTEESRIHVCMEFGGTTFDVTLTDDTLDDTYRHSYDFLRN